MKNFWLLFLLGVVPAGAWILPKILSAPVAPPESRTLASAPGSTNYDLNLLYSPVAGQRYTYSFRREIILRGLDNNFPPITYEGKLHLDVIESGQTGFAALAKETIQGQPDTPVMVKVRADKKGDRVEIFSRPLAKDADRDHESVLKDLLSQLFFPLQSDTVGKYAAEFSPLEKSSGGFYRFKKTKLSYTDNKLLPKIVSSLHILEWSEKTKMPEEITGKESTSMGEGKTALASESGYQLKLLSVSPAGKIKKSLWAELKNSIPLNLAASTRPLSDHPEYASLNWPDLVRKLQVIDQLNASDKLKLFGDLVKFIQLDGKALTGLLAELKSQNAIKAGADSNLFQTVVGTLATVGTPEAQSALLEIYRDPDCPPSGKGSILGALTTTQSKADPGTIEFLADEMEKNANPDLAQGAAFALGAALEKVSSDSEAADPIARLLAAWANAKSISAQIALLDAMGNSGRAEFLPTLNKVLNGTGAPELRAKAVFSLRFIQAGSAKTLMATSLQDADDKVRTASVMAMAFATWSEIFRAALDGCISGEKVEPIKEACTDLRAKAPSTVASN